MHFNVRQNWYFKEAYLRSLPRHKWATSEQYKCSSRHCMSSDLWLNVLNFKIYKQKNIFNIPIRLILLNINEKKISYISDFPLDFQKTLRQCLKRCWKALKSLRSLYKLNNFSKKINIINKTTCILTQDKADTSRKHIWEEIWKSNLWAIKMFLRKTHQ